MPRRRVARALLLASATGLIVAGAPPILATAAGSDANVTVGSPAAPFPRNKQNEPAVAVAVNAADPRILAAGANEEIDEAPCTSSGCPFIPGIGNSGIYFSFDAGSSWIQPTYRGWSDRTGNPRVGPIGTLPKYYENGLVSDGDPALAFGPRPGPNGFSWANGSRLYYANLTSDFPGTTTIPANAEGIAVSRTDDVRAAAAGDMSAWKTPVIASTDLQGHIFSDKEALWVDNAATSRHFGNAYICWTSYRGTDASPILLARSTDGGSTWSDPVLVTHAKSTSFTGPSFCTIRTDSKGAVYVGFENGTDRGVAEQTVSVSGDGGRTFGPARPVADVVLPGRLDPAHVAVGDPRFTMDGLAGAREDAGLSIDIANGAPTGRDATDEIVMGWSDGRNGLNREQALVQFSTDGGRSWSRPQDAAAPGDRPAYTAVAIAPDGSDVYVTYDAFLRPWQRDTDSRRPMQGVVRHADVLGGGGLTDFGTLHRGAVGDARGASQNNLTSEFLGDYNYVVAVRGAGIAVWNDVRNAENCPAVDRYRASLVTNHPLPRPDVPAKCPGRFGNTDIYGGSYADPTP